MTNEGQRPGGTNTNLFLGFGAGLIITLALYIVVLGLSMYLVPRELENARRVVAAPWPFYATFPSIVACVVGLTIGLFLRGSSRSRIAFLLGVAIAVFLSLQCCIDLLRRDYIGKF